MNTENTRTGLTGWLTPEGKFIRCKYGNHCEVAAQILEKDNELRQRHITERIKGSYSGINEFLYVPMGSMGKYCEAASHIGIPIRGNFTEAQMKWLRKNYDKLDETQQYYLDFLGEISGWNKEYEESLRHTHGKTKLLTEVSND